MFSPDKREREHLAELEFSDFPKSEALDTLLHCTPEDFGHAPTGYGLKMFLRYEGYKVSDVRGLRYRATARTWDLLVREGWNYGEDPAPSEEQERYLIRTKEGSYHVVTDETINGMQCYVTETGRHIRRGDVDFVQTCESIGSL